MKSSPENPDAGHRRMAKTNMDEDETLKVKNGIGNGTQCQERLPNEIPA
jgi:hypothetical protein